MLYVRAAVCAPASFTLSVWEHEDRGEPSLSLFLSRKRSFVTNDLGFPLTLYSETSYSLVDETDMRDRVGSHPETPVLTKPSRTP